MRRTYMRESFTDDELANIKSGKCWCGKPRSEFQRGMRVYCSPEHRAIWQSKVLTWQEFRDQFLREHGKKCDMCGVESLHEEYEKLFGEAQKKRERALMELKPSIQDFIIAKKLDLLESDYERRFFEAVDPGNVSIYDLENYARQHKLKIPELPKWHNVSAQPERVFEVDHIQAIVNGGNEFDKSNLQVLCQDCHRKKTKNDMLIANGVKINFIGSQATLEAKQ